MVEIYHGKRWEHPTGAHAWMEEVKGIFHGQEVRQANVHVVVPEEHQRKGIAIELIRQVISDLEQYNREQSEQSKRFHNAFVNLSLAAENYKPALGLFLKAGFEATGDGNNIIVRRYLRNW